MKKIKFVFLFLLIMLVPMLVACGTSSSGVINNDSNNNVTIETTRKIYYTVDYNIKVKNGEIKKSIDKKIEEIGGYISNSSDSNSNQEYVYRVPTEKLNDTLDYIDSFGKSVSNKKVSSKDVTSSYSELEARKEVLLASKEAYLNILKNTTNVSDIILIQTKLDDINTEMLTIEKEIAYYDNLIDYSTITIRYENSDDFNPFSSYGEYLLNFVTFVGVAILYMLPITLLGVIIYLVYKLIKSKVKKNEKL